MNKRTLTALLAVGLATSIVPVALQDVNAQSTTQSNGATLRFPSDTLIIIDKSDKKNHTIIERGIRDTDNTKDHILQASKKIDYLKESVDHLLKYYQKVDEPFSHSLELTLTSLQSYLKAYSELGTAFTVEDLVRSQMGPDAVHKIASSNYLRDLSKALQGYGYTISFDLPPDGYTPILAKEMHPTNNPLLRDRSRLITSGDHRGFIALNDGYLVPGAKIYDMEQVGFFKYVEEQRTKDGINY